MPDLNREFIIHCDGSKDGLGAVLMQEQLDGSGLRPICFISKILRGAEKHYSALELEMFAVVWSVSKFQPYIEMTNFITETDHNRLLFLLNNPGANGRFNRWANRLFGLNFTVKYREGKNNVIADSLSQAPVSDGEISKKHFIDDILPLNDDKIKNNIIFENPNTFDDKNDVYVSDNCSDCSEKTC